jgi:V/A-type H+-transporting ATPase subunit I
VIPLILMAFRAPIISFLEKKKELIHGGVGLFLFETVIEAFEMILSYFTNTVSFVRVGAFALSHASMMGVVMMLSATASGSNNIAVVILGNVLVMCLEGLIVGIQVLRLEFYEMFSRFYSGAGREFIPYNKLYK